MIVQRDCRAQILSRSVLTTMQWPEYGEMEDFLRRAAAVNVYVIGLGICGRKNHIKWSNGKIHSNLVVKERFEFTFSYT